MHIQQIMAALPEDASEATKDAIYQTYLSMFPATSLARNFMKSENIKGGSLDAAAVYGDMMIKWSRKLGDTMYIPKIDAAVKYFEEKGQYSSNPHIVAASRNIVDKAEFLRNPTYAPIASMLTSFSYSTFLLGNVSSGVVNLSALGLMTYPLIGGEYGYPQTAGYMKIGAKVASFSIKG